MVISMTTVLSKNAFSYLSTSACGLKLIPTLSNKTAKALSSTEKHRKHDKHLDPCLHQCHGSRPALHLLLLIDGLNTVPRRHARVRVYDVTKFTKTVESAVPELAPADAVRTGRVLPSAARLAGEPLADHVTRSTYILLHAVPRSSTHVQEASVALALNLVSEVLLADPVHPAHLAHAAVSIEVRRCARTGFEVRETVVAKGLALAVADLIVARA